MFILLIVENLSEKVISNMEEVVAMLALGTKNRRVASNNVNEHSSRSHLVMVVRVDRENIRTGQISKGVLYLIDLAGSERIKNTNATGDRLKEAQHISKSLSALGDVVCSLSSNAKHIPYRNSKLTFLLQDTLREHSKVLMFVNINPLPSYASESICSLNFAARCKSVVLGAAKATIQKQQSNSLSTSSISDDLK